LGMLERSFKISGEPPKEIQLIKEVIR